MPPRKFGRYSVSITHPDRILFPDDGFTKQDLISYYEAVAPVMLRYSKDRPLSMKRFPEGIGKDGFYQKGASDYFPDWIRTTRLKKKGGAVNHVVCDKLATLIYLTNQSTIEHHLGLSRADKINHPDQLVFDLDPAGDDFKAARRAALEMRPLYDDLGLPVFVKTSGAKGLHLLTPLDRSSPFEEVREFARRMAEVVAAENPDWLTTEGRIAKREGRLFLDTGRNAYAATAVCAYSVRARPGAPVATPLHWEELDNPRFKPSRFTIKNVPARLNQEGDAWSGMGRGRSLRAASRKLERLKT